MRVLTPTRLLVIIALLVGCLSSERLVDFAFGSEELGTRPAPGEGGSQRIQVQQAMRSRPTDPWPRGEGHVVLSRPGAGERWKAYHEPGGSFSPSVSSFGVSLWVTNAAGDILHTSDNIPLNELKQRFQWAQDHGIPALISETPYYTASWSLSEGGAWKLQLTNKTGEAEQLQLVIRSVGPAGGPINRLDWTGAELKINKRWTVAFSPPPSHVTLGSEQVEGWLTRESDAHRLDAADGWGYARLPVPWGGELTVAISDPAYKLPRSLRVSHVRSSLDLQLPDDRFAECINAQVAHLMMSLVDTETRPGEPLNYPLTWLRDGAYVVVSLARAGRLDLAKDLSTLFAERDFFGGFGPEADGPGLSLWVIEEVAARSRSEDYDRRVWPHVKRKAEFILTMLSTPVPIRMPVEGPIVPRWRGHPELPVVCDPARDGLIVGKMDHHRPILYVNAVSYRGLTEAAEMADRLGYGAEARRWRDAALGIRRSWAAGLKTAEARNERTYICGIWPAWIAETDNESFVEGLESRWARLRDAKGGFLKKPLWTYFTAAEAHQWLMLGNQHRAWLTLQWFWDNQASPGLYTWWEGRGEENSFGLWEQVRGWVNPPYVTPHYWTAAEVLLLQLDMLCYLDEGAPERVLVIGSGIPRGWLDRPMHARNISTRVGSVDWSWENHRMHVTIRGKRCPVRLGPAFPPRTPLVIKGSE